MREIDKLDKGMPYHFDDEEVAARKARAAQLCQEFNAIPATEPAQQESKIRQILGSAVETFHSKRHSIVITGKIYMSDMTS